jgi:hypothetical protein
MPAVKDLFIALGLKMDDTAFAAADVAITGLKKGLLATGVAFGGVIAGFAAMLKQTADAGTQTARTARQVGLTTQQLQGLRFAASDAGVGADELDGAMKALSRSSYEASIHGGAAGVAFYRLGIQAFTSYGKARPLQQLLPEIADRFAKLPDSVEKTAWATSIFGDAGAALIPLLNKGRGALEELSKEAVRFGVVMDAKSIAAAEGCRGRSATSTRRSRACATRSRCPGCASSPPCSRPSPTGSRRTASSSPPRSPSGSGS